jgi:hypothetical protein
MPRMAATRVSGRARRRRRGARPHRGRGAGKRLRALGGGEVLVARGQGEAVGFADGGAGDDLDGKRRSRTIRRMMRSCWASFSPKTATWGRTRLNSLATTVQTPSKWPGREAPQSVRERAVSTTTRWRPRDRSPRRRGKEDIHALLFAQGAIGLERARIGGEILVGAELGGVDEEGDDDDIGVPPGDADQGEVALVQVAHGGHEADAPARFFRAAIAPNARWAGVWAGSAAMDSTDAGPQVPLGRFINSGNAGGPVARDVWV